MEQLDMKFQEIGQNSNTSVKQGHKERKQTLLSFPQTNIIKAYIPLSCFASRVPLGFKTSPKYSTV